MIPKRPQIRSVFGADSAVLTPDYSATSIGDKVMRTSTGAAMFESHRKSFPNREMRHDRGSDFHRLAQGESAFHSGICGECVLHEKKFAVQSAGIGSVIAVVCRLVRLPPTLPRGDLAC